MPIPETTSAEAFERYVGGKCLAVGQGEAWREVKARVVALPPAVEALLLPSVSEPFLAWTTSGEVDFQEREGRIEPGRVFDRVTDLDGVPDGYRAMDEREAIKVMIGF